MRVLIVVLSLLALSRAQAQVQVRLPFGNGAGIKYTGAGFGNQYTVSPGTFSWNSTKS
jgi:hypothetical protein